jgi:uncharacterized protein
MVRAASADASSQAGGVPGRKRSEQRPHARAGRSVKADVCLQPKRDGGLSWRRCGPVSCVRLCAVTWVVRCIASDYTWDVREIRWTDKSEDHIAAHNVTPEEVEQVLYARPRLVLKGAEGTEYAFGTTDEGRYLLVVLAESIDGRAYVVTARDMTNAERQAFRRKGR